MDIKKTNCRTKPEIYRTTDGTVIVEDELLNFLAVKMKTLSQDEIVVLVTKHFDPEWIESSKKVLFELCPTTHLCVSHEGPQKDADNIKSCLKVMNECEENLPRFVSHYLDELPPSTSQAEASVLLGRMEQLCAEVCATKDAVHLQADAGENLSSIASELNRRLSALELSAKPKNQVGALNAREAGVGGAGVGAQGGCARRSKALDASKEGPKGSKGGKKRAAGSRKIISKPRSSKRSLVVKKGQHALRNVAARSRSRMGAPRLKKKSNNSIKAVKTKSVVQSAADMEPACRKDKPKLNTTPTRGDRVRHKSAQQELKQRQRAEIYALNKVMTELEQQQFETFCKQMQSQGE